MLLQSNSDHTDIAVFLFNTNIFLSVHNATPLVFLDQKINSSVVFKCIEIEPKKYVSGIRAPFGGIECRDVKNIDAVVKEIIDTCKELGAGSITIRQSPDCYQPGTSEQIKECLLANGFTLQYADVNQHILIDASRSFVSTIDDQKRRRLQKLKYAGARVQFFNHIHTDDWYELYVCSRKIKNFPLTISKQAYYDLSQKLPGVYQYVGVFIDNKLIANAVVVKVSKDVLYYFVAASDPGYTALSPSVMIIEAIYGHACEHGFSMIDLGISSVNGMLNEGLHLFKKHVGGMDSQKNTFEFKY